ncbi:MAG: efflux RND transporter permease subunit, partial [Bacteroidota bacterium]
MKNTIEFLTQRPSLVNIFIGLIIVVGLFTLFSIRNTFFPSEPVNFISVNVVYRGASPQEVEEEVINKIEDNLQGLKGILRVTSTATESNGNVRIELKEDADVNEVLQDVNNAVDRITTFPAGTDTPVILKEEPLNYTMTVSLVGDVSLATLKDYAKHMKDELILSPSLSQITISGYPEEEIEVRVRESDLRAYELTFEEVSRAIQQTNLKASGGEVETDQRNILIRLDNRDYYAKGLLNTVVKATPDGKAILLKDVAEVKNRFADKPDATFINGQTAVTMTIFSRFQEDILDNAAYVADYMQQFNEGHKGVEAVIVEDKSLGLTTTIGTLTDNAWQGILLVLIVLGLFLHPRIAFWVAFKIPVALLGMFILSNFYEMTI